MGGRAIEEVVEEKRGEIEGHNISFLTYSLIPWYDSSLPRSTLRESVHRPGKGIWILLANKQELVLLRGTIQRNINYKSQTRYRRLDHNSSAWSQATGSNKNGCTSKNSCIQRLNASQHTPTSLDFPKPSTFNIGANQWSVTLQWRLQMPIFHRWFQCKFQDWFPLSNHFNHKKVFWQLQLGTTGLLIWS